MLIATNNELLLLEPSDAPAQPQVLLDNDHIQAIATNGIWHCAAVTDNRIRFWLGHTERSLWTSDIAERIKSLCLLATDPAVLIIGTEPPHIFRLSQTENAATRMKAFDQLTCRPTWFTPWGGPPAVRSLALAGATRLYANVHVGSIMRSDDAGVSWEPVDDNLEPDVHQVKTTPAAPQRVYANTARGVWVSQDGGDSWEKSPFPHPVEYGLTIAVHPNDPDCLLATASEEPDYGRDVRARLFRSDDAGRNWQHIVNGFPAYSPTNIRTHCVAFDAAGIAWAAVEDRLYTSIDRGTHWQMIWQAPAKIQQIACH